MFSFLKNKLSFKNYRVLFSDFDGVLTDNTVLISQDGIENVKCSRADGLAFDYFNDIGFPVFILSTETNKVVQERANKLNVTCVQNSKNKVNKIKPRFICLKIVNETTNEKPIISSLNKYCVENFSWQ